jgi:hypothetical protein
VLAEGKAKPLRGGLAPGLAFRCARRTSELGRDERLSISIEQEVFGVPGNLLE